MKPLRSEQAAMKCCSLFLIDKYRYTEPFEMINLIADFITLYYMLFFWKYNKMVQNFCEFCTILNYIVVYLSEMTSFIASRRSFINEFTTSLWIPRLLRTLHVFSTRNSIMELFIDLAIDSFSKPCQTTSKPKISPPLYKCISWPVCPIHLISEWIFQMLTRLE